MKNKTLEEKPYIKNKSFMETVKVEIRLPKIKLFGNLKNKQKKFRIIYRNYAYIIQYKNFGWKNLKMNFVINDDIINGFYLKEIMFIEHKTLEKAKEFLEKYKEAISIRYKKHLIKFAVYQNRTGPKITYYLPKYRYYNRDLDAYVFYTRFTSLNLAKKEVDSIKNGENSNYKSEVVYTE